MENRLKFKEGQQKDFLLQVYKASNLSTDELAKMARVVPRSFRDWRREKLSIPLNAALTFKDKFKVFLPEPQEILVNRWKKCRSESGRKGGFALFRKHGSPATLEGRRKGGLKSMAILRKRGVMVETKKFNLPTKFSNELAEFVGIMLGDGGLTLGQITVTLNSIKDHEYSLYVKNLMVNLFGQTPGIFYRRNENTLIIYYNGVLLVRYLVKIGLRIGHKVRQQVGVPKWIHRSEKYKINCLRGLMDTDGGVFTHKYKVNDKLYFYKKICFTNRSVPLLKFVFNTLIELGFTPKIILKIENKKVWLYNETEVERYLDKVGTHNQRLLRGG